MPNLRWRVVFAVVVAVHLVPIWTVPLLPTVDGPAHVYNALALRELARGNAAFAQVFEADLKPHPNWLGHLAMFALQFVVPPVIAEKILFTAIVVLFLGGAWSLAGVVDERNRIYAFLAAPLTFHLLLQMGFYNYSLGAALVPFAVVLAWRRRRGATAAMLTVCYFAHVVPAALAVLFVGVLAIARRSWRDLVAVVPASLLLAWFALQPERPGGDFTWNGALLVEPLWRVALLMTFDVRQLLFGAAIGAAYGVLIAVTLVADRGRWIFALLTAIAVALFLAAPLSVQEGLILKARLLVFPYVLVLPWLTPRAAKPVVGVVLAVVASVNALYVGREWRRNVPMMEQSQRVLDAAQMRKKIVPLIFDRSATHATIPLLSHAFSYGATRRQLVDLGNYEGSAAHFPVRFRQIAQRPDRLALETAPQDFDVARFANAADYLYTWRMPSGSDIERRIGEHYSLVRADGEARLYEVRAPVRRTH